MGGSGPALGEQSGSKRYDKNVGSLLEAESRSLGGDGGAVRAAGGGLDASGVGAVGEVADPTGCLPWIERYPRVAALILGQVISLVLTGTGVFTQYLAKEQVQLPTTQSTLNYLLLVFYMVKFLRSKRVATGESAPSCKPAVKWWVYLLLAIADVEANYLIVKAYQYTTITSVMLFDCLTIPIVMILSYSVLGTKYSRKHMVGAALCVVGIAVLAVSDATGSSKDRDQYPHAFRGDMLCVLATLGYAISNVGEEVVVKIHSRQEFLGMLGSFGLLVNGVQLVLLERHELGTTTWSPTVAMHMLGFVACLFTMYSLVPVFLQRCDAALFNLSMLTSDFWGVIAGVVLFQDKLGVYYVVSFCLIVSGIVVFNDRPVQTAVSQKLRAFLASGAAPLEGGRRLAEDEAQLLSAESASTQPMCGQV